MQQQRADLGIAAPGRRRLRPLAEGGAHIGLLQLLDQLGFLSPLGAYPYSDQLHEGRAAIALDSPLKPMDTMYGRTSALY